MEDTLIRIEKIGEVKKVAYILDAQVIYGEGAKFFHGSDFPVFVAEGMFEGERDRNYLVLDNPASVKEFTKEGAWVEKVYDAYVKSIAQWFREKEQREGFVDDIGFRSVYFGGLFRDMEVVRAEHVFKSEGYRSTIDFGGVIFAVGSDGVECVVPRGSMLTREHVDFMKALNTIRLFGYEGVLIKNVPPLPSKVVEKIKDALSLPDNMPDEKVISTVKGGAWVEWIDSSDDVYALATALRERVAEVVVQNYKIDNDGFREVWERYEDMMVKELNNEGLRFLPKVVEKKAEAGASKKKDMEIGIGM